MKTEEQYFREGKSIQQYMDEMGNLKEESFHVYQELQLLDDGFADELAKQSLHFLIITEDWCGDAMMINPVIRRLAEAADIEVRVTLRDADTELIDRHLTNGGRAIPIVLILNDEGTLIGKWGPRAPEVQRIVDDLRATLPAKDDPSFPKKQKEMISSLQKRYKEEHALWLYVYQSFKKTLLSVLN